MVPFALLKDGSAFVIHVSRLAAHTNDMLMDPRVSLLITGSERTDGFPLAGPRVTLHGTARQLSGDAPEYPVTRQAYLARFPEAASIFNLSDFSLFVISVTGVRWIAGFAQARSLAQTGRNHFTSFVRTGSHGQVKSAQRISSAWRLPALQLQSGKIF